LRANLKKNSRFTAYGFTSGSVLSRQDYKIALLGEGAEAQLGAIAMLEEKAQTHANVLVEHAAPSCQSMQKFKSVLYDKSRSSFQGKILVRQIAQQTNAYQRNNNLILSPLAHAYAKPNLEIFADDVKASHGATFGQVDKEQLLYLKTRGLTTAQAKKLLVFGFCEEVLEEITIPSLRARLEEYCGKYGCNQ
jgi:Fe-S cluster assembly protein SufD